MSIILEISVICLWIVVLFNLFLTFALVRRLNLKGSNNTETKQRIVDLDVGDSAPNFTAQKLESGETVTLTSFAGRKLALIFISTHCQPCEEILPQLRSLKAKAMEANIELALISAEEVEATRTYVAEEAIDLPVFVAPRKTNTFIKDYKVTATPAFCLITAQGSIYRSGPLRLQGNKWRAFNDFLSERSDFVVAGGGETEEVGSR